MAGFFIFEQRKQTGMTDITQLTAERIEKFLPGALEKAIRAYDEHCRCGTPPDKDGKVTSRAVTDQYEGITVVPDGRRWFIVTRLLGKNLN
jgi:hypothetical protein